LKATFFLVVGVQNSLQCARAVTVVIAIAVNLVKIMATKRLAKKLETIMKKVLKQDSITVKDKTDIDKI
jgi:hypothetical protein